MKLLIHSETSAIWGVISSHTLLGMWLLIHAEMKVDPYRKISNIRHTLVGNEIVDLSDVLGAAPAPTTSSFST